MAQILVPDFDEAMLKSLESQAALNGRSLEEEVRAILERAAEFGQKLKGTSSKKSLFGAMKGTAEVVGDIVSPLDSEDWNALR